MYFAEFLNASSLVHLSILSLPTCVGLRYGSPHPDLSGCFSALWLHPLHPPVGGLAVTAHLGTCASLCPSTACRFDRNYRSPAGPRLTRHRIENVESSGILTRFPSTTHFCLALGADLPLGRLP